MKKFGLILIAFVCGLLADFAARTALNNAILVSDMDANGHKILNLPNDQPLPSASISDGSITNVKISPTAAIDQTKLNLSGPIPPSFLGLTATTAAEGDLAEYLIHKGQANGYPSLDGSGRIPSSQLPALAGTGTVTSVSVTTANGISGTVATATTTPAISLSLAAITPTKVSLSGTGGNGYLSFAVQSADPSETQAHLWTDTNGRLAYWQAVATSLHRLSLGAPTLSANHNADFPNKDGTVAFTSDLPTAMVGVGGSHKGGLVIDTEPTGSVTDYLARDATWKAIPSGGASYQPTVPTPFIFPSSNTTGNRTISFNVALSGTAIFYNVGDNVGPFSPYVGGTVSLPPGQTIFTYAAKSGYSNSAFASYTNSNP